MFTRFIFVIVIVLSFAFSNRANAQKQIFYQDGEPGAEGPPSQAHGTSNSILVPCTVCSTNSCVRYSTTENVTYSDGWQFLTITITFTNTNTSGPDIKFVVCAMAEFEQPWLNGHYGPGPELLGSTTDYELHRSTGPPCQYYCVEGMSGGMGTSYVPSDGIQQWSYYLGCAEIDIPPNGSASFHAPIIQFKPGQPVAYNFADMPPAAVPIRLSSNHPDNSDHTIRTWNFSNIYMDIIEDCSIRMSGTNNCEGLMSAPNVELLPTDCSDMPPPVDPATCNTGGACYINNWLGTGNIIKSGGGGGSASATCDVGNWLTMAHMMNAYPARMFVTLANAPAGTKLTGVCPYDTLLADTAVKDSLGMTIEGSGTIYTDTSLGGCNSDTLGFQFPFLIPAGGGHMIWNLTLPANSCSNFGNGRRIYLRGEVYAASASPIYDSGQFMYGVAETFIYDTTPPIASSFTLHALDSTHLLVNLTGTDDTTIVNAGYVSYTINGGADTTQLLRFQNDTAIGHTTNFQDTIVSPVPHATIKIRGYVANQLGLLDSTTIDTCHLPEISPASVNGGVVGDCKIESILVDRTHSTITIKLETTGGSLLLSLADELGRAWSIMPTTTLAPGDQIVIRSLPELPRGVYFLRLQTGTCDVLEKVIL